MENKSNWGSGEPSNADKLIEREKIEGTPFWIVGTKDKGYRTVLGKWQITEIHETKQKLLDWMTENYYTIILTMIIVVGEDIQNKKEELKQNVRTSITETVNEIQNTND